MTVAYAPLNAYITPIFDEIRAKTRLVNVMIGHD